MPRRRLGGEVPGYEARVVDETGRDVADGETGNLLVSGDSAAAGYWKQHEKTKATFEGRWVHTGDKYIRHADGCFDYRGRSDDMLKVGGIWVSPIEVEHTILTHPQVAECAVVGAADADGLIKPRAFVVLRPGVEPGHTLTREIQAFVRERIAAYNTRAGSSSSRSCPKRQRARFSGFGCAAGNTIHYGRSSHARGAAAREPQPACASPPARRARRYSSLTLEGLPRQLLRATAARLTRNVSGWRARRTEHGVRVAAERRARCCTRVAA